MKTGKAFYLDVLYVDIIKLNQQTTLFKILYVSENTLKDWLQSSIKYKIVIGKIFFQEIEIGITVFEN